MMSGGVLRQAGLVSEIRPGQGVTSDPIPLYRRGYYRPGIVIFSRRQKLLHASRRALELMDQLDPSELEPVHEIHSTPVHELRHAIQAALDHRRAADIWEIFELKRIIFEVRRTILVRGFGLADRKSYEDSRIVIVLEELGARKEHSETGRLSMAPSQESVVVVLGSAQLGSDRRVFDASIDGSSGCDTAGSSPSLSHKENHDERSSSETRGISITDASWTGGAR